ncbi:MAG: hypothetical protein HUK02_06065 [Bacteroidaceae bacterium]|nr:hypothetical protein [Bacteroidaceae bacterium]
MQQKKCVFLLMAALFAVASSADGQDHPRLSDGVEVALEVSGTASTGDFAPLWLSANRYGKVSALANSAYERVAVTRSADVDSLHNWRFGYGADVLLHQNSPSVCLPHQVYVSAAWKKISLTLGAKERTMDLRNDALTTGALLQGVNSTPIPEALLNVDYFGVPGTKNWWQVTMRLGYGMTTDGRWQQRWIGDPTRMRYTGNILHHEKIMYWKFGNEQKFPLTYSIGLQMMTQFGGTSYNINNRGVVGTVKHSQNLRSFWHAFFPVGGSDVTDGVNPNAEGNTIGSYNMRLQWTQDDWSVAAYFERMFEDQSMLTVQYGIYDHLVGVEAQLPKNPFLRHVVVEHMSTKDQAGPVYHDATPNIPESYTGVDNYYNHHVYAGWQHWGMAIGNPLITSPIYNADHQLIFRNNRLLAWHVGLDGAPCDQVRWRFLGTFTQNWGTYVFPLAEVEKEQHLLAEATYLPSWAKGWLGTFGLGLTHGQLVGNTFGAQLTIRKTFKL